MFSVKRSFAAFLAVVICISTMSGAVFGLAGAGESPEAPRNLPVWDGTVAESYAGGSGTKDDPYLISDGSELALLMQDINSTESEANQNTAGKYYKLTADIVLNDISDLHSWEDSAPANKWTPGGAVKDYTIRGFAGFLDGNHYDVIGMYVNSDSGYNGLFGYVLDAQIKNLGIKYSYVKGRQSTAALAGYVRSRKNPVYISGCSIDEHTVVEGTNHVGGIGGYVEAFNKNIFIDKCSNDAVITANYNYAGGIVGSLVAFYESSVSDYAVEVTDCRHGAYIYGNMGIGGIIGSTKDFLTDMAGKKISLLIKNCINTGHIPTSTPHKGAIIGIVGPSEREDKNVVTDIIGCYSTTSDAMTKIYGYSEATTNTDTSKLYTDTEMSDEKNFAGFDFEGLWSIINASFPTHRLLGDSMNRGKVTAQDVIDTLAALVGGGDVSDYEIANIDFNDDGIYSLADVNTFMAYLKGKGADNTISGQKLCIVMNTTSKRTDNGTEYYLECYEPGSGVILTEIPADKSYNFGSVVLVNKYSAIGSPLFGNAYTKGTVLNDVTVATANAGYCELASYDIATGVLKISGSDTEYIVTEDTVITYSDKSNVTFKEKSDADIFTTPSKIYYQNDDRTNPMRVVLCTEKRGDVYNLIWVMIVRD